MAGAAHGFEMPFKTGTDAGVGDVIQFIGSPAPADQQLVSVRPLGPWPDSNLVRSRPVKVPILAILERSAGLARRALLALLCLLPLLGLAHEVKAGGDGSDGAQPTGSRARP